MTLFPVIECLVKIIVIIASQIERSMFNRSPNCWWSLIILWLSTITSPFIHWTSFHSILASLAWYEYRLATLILLNHHILTFNYGLHLHWYRMFFVFIWKLYLLLRVTFLIFYNDCLLLGLFIARGQNFRLFFCTLMTVTTLLVVWRS